MPRALPSLAELRDAAVPFALPLTRTFRGLDVREGMLIKGPNGWGEFAPFDDYDDAHAARWLASAVEATFGEWPEPPVWAVPVNAIIPAVDSGDAATLARHAYMEHGCTTIKVKAGSGLLADEARIASVRDVLDTVAGRGVGRIRIDANGAWTVEQAVTHLRRLSAYGIEYVEQPCATLDELRDLRSRIDVPIAVDEPLRQADDPLDPALHRSLRESADLAIVKPAPLGGVRASIDVAEALGMPVVVSGSLDSSVGLATALHAAAHLVGSDADARACGLGTGTLLAADLTAETYVPAHGELPVTRLAPELDHLLAARDRLSADRADEWFARLAAAHDALAQ